MCPVTLGADHIAGAAGGFEPQRRNNFLLRLTPKGGSGQVIELSLSKCPFPQDTTSVHQIRYMNGERKFPGRTTYPQMEINLVDYVDQGTLREIAEWRRKVYDPLTGRGGFCSAFKVQATLLMFAPDGVATRQWKLHGVWPSAANYGANGGGDMDSADESHIGLTLQLDWFEVLNASAA